MNNKDMLAEFRPQINTLLSAADALQKATERAKHFNQDPEIIDELVRQSTQFCRLWMNFISDLANSHPEVLKQYRTPEGYLVTAVYDSPHTKEMWDLFQLAQHVMCFATPGASRTEA